MCKTLEFIRVFKLEDTEVQYESRIALDAADIKGIEEYVIDYLKSSEPLCYIHTYHGDCIVVKADFDYLLAIKKREDKNRLLYKFN